MSDVMEKETVLEMTRTLAGSLARVFKAWTDPKIMAQWFSPHGMTSVIKEMDVQPGGNFHAVISGEEDHAVRGIYRVVEPPHRLVFSWVWQQGDLKDRETEVELTFVPEGEGTRLTLIHRDLPSATSVTSHSGGWGSAIESLKDKMAHCTQNQE